MPKKLTKEEFINREPDLSSGEYEFIGNYVTANTKTLFKHNTCGYKWNAKPNGFQRGTRCPKCAGNIKMTKREFCNRETDLLSGEYEFIGDYINSQIKTLFKHSKCGCEWMITPKNFHKGRRCPRCAKVRFDKEKSFTKKGFCQREKDIISGEYSMLGNYVNANTKTLFKHSICGYKWEVTPAGFYSGHRCPKCSGHIKLAKDEFCKREEDIRSGEYVIIGNYTNTSTRTLFKHNLCGYKWEMSPSSFHTGRRCPVCSGRGHRFNKREFCGRESDIQSGEYEIVGEYEGANAKTLFKHHACGYEWETRPVYFHSGNRCPKCAGHMKLTKDTFCKREKDIVSGEYSMLGEYINTSTKTLFKHNTCGYEWMMAPSCFYIGTRCPRCAAVYQHNKQRFTKQEFINREKDILSGEYEMVSEYINSQTKTTFRHNICGYQWEALPKSFYRGTRCPKCNESKGEKKISKVLEEINIPFESQKRFDSCRHKLPLPFDFYVNDSFLIEYDGVQHFESVDHFGGDEGFEIRQLRDNIKTQWAKDNGIPLVRIPYTEFDDIEQIIKESIEKYSIQKVG